MRLKGATIQQFLLASALLAGLAWNLAHADELQGVRLASGPTGTRAELPLDREVRFDMIRLASPERLVIDLPGTSLRKDLLLPSGSGLVQAIRSGHPVNGTTRIVFDLADQVVPVRPHFENGGDGARLVLEWPGETTAAVASSSAAATSRLIARLPDPAKAPAPAPLRTRREHSRCKTWRTRPCWRLAFGVI